MNSQVTYHYNRDIFETINNYMDITSIIRFFFYNMNSISMQLIGHFEMDNKKWNETQQVNKLNWIVSEGEIHAKKTESRLRSYRWRLRRPF